MRRIQLPPAAGYEGLGIGKVIERRRSERDFSGEAISLLDLSRLLYYATGVTEERWGLRAAPSAGATYPIEVYPVVNSVDGLPQGIYHYLIHEHSLEFRREGDFRRELVSYALGQELSLIHI